MALSRAVMSGVVLSDPEKRFTPNNIAVTQFSIQVTSQNPNDKPFTVVATCWRQLAETAAEQLRAGETVTLEGRLQIHRTEQAGNFSSNYELDVSTLYKGQPQLLGASAPMGSNSAKSNSMDSQPQPAMAMASSSGPSQPVPNDFMATEDDIPF
jgi:single-strand DNA-binding protein